MFTGGDSCGLYRLVPSSHRRAECVENDGDVDSFLKQCAHYRRDIAKACDDHGGTTESQADQDALAATRTVRRLI